MNKKSIIFSIVGLVVVLIILLIVLFAGMFGNFAFVNREYKTVVFDKTYENVEEISIAAYTGNINLKYSDDDTVRVEIASKKKYVNVKNEDNKLTINVKGNKCNFMCFNTKSSHITVYLPKNYNKKVIASLDLGDIHVVNFKKLTLDVSNDLGDIKIDGVANLTGKAKMGDIKVKNVYSYINIKNNMGDIKIDNLTITKDSTIKNNMGDIKITKTNNIYVDADVDLGDVKVKKNNRKADISLKIKNNMGDIKVNY